MQIIAHRGASGERPEHTLGAYALAIAQGIDIIEPDLMFTADGVLVCRHDLGLRRSTNAAAHFALSADADVSVADLTLSELRQLRCRQPWAQRSAAFDGLETIPTFAELLDLVEHERARTGRQLRVYPEAKHPEVFHARGHDFAAALLAEFQRRAWARGQAPVWLQCFDHTVLRELGARTGLQCYALVDTDDVIDIDALSTWAHGLGVNKRRLLQRDASASAFARSALASGLELHAWTVRHDVPNPDFARTEDELVALARAGVSACFCDFPGQARDDLDRALQPKS